MNDPALTGSHNYFEDFTPGLVIRHSRGKTVEALENQFITNLVMNTADGHFNEHLMKQTPFGTRIVFGGVTASIVIGLAAQDTAENALAELSITGLRLEASGRSRRHALRLSAKCWTRKTATARMPGSSASAISGSIRTTRSCSRRSAAC